MDSFADETTARIASFLNEIGIHASPATLDEPTFLPGIRIYQGGMLIDESKLLYPGDLLHEAGHLAVVPSGMRRELTDDVTIPEEPMHAIEVAAMAWSYAAALHIGIDPGVVFHDKGYHGQALGLLLSYTIGVYPGANGLEDAGLTATGSRAGELGVPPFPHMLKWVRD